MNACVMRRLFKSLLLAGGVLAATGAGSAFAQDWMKTLQGTIGTITQKPSGSETGAIAGLTTQDIAAGLKEALRVGTQRVSQQLGAQDGFNLDDQVHIPLPPELRSVQSRLRRFGLSGLADDIELKLNRGAEAAMPKARELVVNAIKAMTLEDAKAIYNGPNDAATQYFRRVASDDLKATIEPVMEETLGEVGALAAYDELTAQYQAIPFVPDLNADLTEHATQKALDGLFHYLAVEEAAIRTDPVKRTTELLTKVFGR